VTLSLLTAVSLCLFVIESATPPFVPLPGIKLGLANIITLFILFSGGFNTRDAAMSLTARILLSAFVTGSGTALLYSAAGGFCAFSVTALLRKVLKGELITTASVAGAAAHNAGQILAAAAVYGSSGVLLYLPILIFGGIVSGLLTGIAAAIIIKRIKG